MLLSLAHRNSVLNKMYFWLVSSNVVRSTWHHYRSKYLRNWYLHLRQCFPYFLALGQQTKECTCRSKINLKSKTCFCWTLGISCTKQSERPNCQSQCGYRWIDNLDRCWLRSLLQEDFIKIVGWHCYSRSKDCWIAITCQILGSKGEVPILAENLHYINCT